MITERDHGILRSSNKSFPVSRIPSLKKFENLDKIFKGEHEHISVDAVLFAGSHYFLVQHPVGFQSAGALAAGPHLHEIDRDIF